MTLPLAARMAAGLILLASAVGAPPGAAAGCDDGAPGCASSAACPGLGAASASITNMAADSVMLQTQAASATLALPTHTASIVASTKGAVEVWVDHRCISGYDLLWMEESYLTGTDVGVFTEVPHCVDGTHLHTIPVRNDVASVSLILDWYGCDRSKGKEFRDVTAFGVSP